MSARQLRRWVTALLTAAGFIVALLILGHLLIETLVAAHGLALGDASRRAEADRLARRPCFEDDDREAVVQLLEEEARVGGAGSAVARPYYHFVTRPFRGEHVNVGDDHLRATLNKEGVQPDAETVFVFGGSTVFGIGAPDRETLPSQLQARLGPGYDVYNYGERGFVFTQEISRLLELVAHGEAPDVAVFYHGFNDVYAGVYSPAVPGSIAPAIYAAPRRLTTGEALRAALEASGYGKAWGWLTRVIGRPERQTALWEQGIAPDIERNAARVVAIHDAQIATVQAIARAHGFRVFFYWQPWLLDHDKPPRRGEPEIRAEASEVFARALASTHHLAIARFSEREAEQVYHLGDLFDDGGPPVYVDGIHVTGRGNRIIAERIAADLTGGPARE